MHKETWTFPAQGASLMPALDRVGAPDASPSLTIGVPVYKRPQELRRCLRSLTRQTNLNFHLILSNDYPQDALEETLADFDFGEIARVSIYNQPQNVGSLSNFRFLRDIATTEFFMWLANDDEVSETYVEVLLDLLARNPDAICAMGQWKLMRCPDVGSVIPQHLNDSASTAVRMAKYVLRSDDAFFYGIFRKTHLDQGDFPGYFAPNAGFIRNWCYIFQFYTLLFGRVVYTDDCCWINHDYGEKFYPGTPSFSGFILNLLPVALRRVNVYILYVRACFEKRLSLVPLILVMSVLALSYEALISAKHLARRALGAAFRRIRNVRP
jgi:glycosyltransferase involved in cell wall biosynthesis